MYYENFTNIHCASVLHKPPSQQFHSFTSRGGAEPREGEGEREGERGGEKEREREKEKEGGRERGREGGREGEGEREGERGRERERGGNPEVENKECNEGVDDN